jgi:hypothetical protein
MEVISHQTAILTGGIVRLSLRRTSSFLDSAVIPTPELPRLPVV